MNLWEKGNLVSELNVPSLRFSEFNGKWTKSSLKKVLKDLIDCEHKTAPYVEYSEYLVVRTNNVKDGRLQYKDIKYTTTEGFKDWTKRKIPSYGDILFTREAPAGESCLVPNDKMVCLGQRMVLLKPDLSKINELFLLWFLQSYNGQKAIRNFVIGTTVTRINIKDIYRIHCSIPRLPEQQKIASFLTAVDSKIEQLNKKQTLLKAYKKGVMQGIFSQKIRFEADDGTAFPEWEEKKMGEVCSFFSGGTPTSTNREFYKGTIPFIGSGNISSEYVEQYISELALENSSSKMVRKGDLLYALYGATSGKLAISKMDGAINQAVLCIRSNESLYFLYYWLSYKKETIIETYLQGGQGNLSATIIKKLKLNMPSLKEQTKIANFLSSIDTKIEQVTLQVNATKDFKKALLQQMFV